MLRTRSGLLKLDQEDFYETEDILFAGDALLHHAADDGSDG